MRATSTIPLAVAQIVADIGLDEISVDRRAAARRRGGHRDHRRRCRARLRRRGGRDRRRRHQARADPASTRRRNSRRPRMRKMLVAMAKDLRVLVIKLADRLHNMRTIAAMPLEKQQRIAQETLDIYAPLAHRLGMQEMKQQLEDLAFASLHPKRFAELDHLVSSRTPGARPLPRQDARRGARAARRAGHHRPRSPAGGKHLWSIYEKMVVKGREFDEIFDLIAHPGGRRLDEGLLRRARIDPRPLAAGRGAVQGLHRDAQVQPLPEPAHHGDRARRQADRGADPHRRDAPAGRVGRRRALGVQGGLRQAGRHRLAEPHHRLAGGDLRPGRSSWRT